MFSQARMFVSGISTNWALAMPAPNSSKEAMKIDRNSRAGRFMNGKVGDDLSCDPHGAGA
ncbi:MAG: hypothetical protein KDB75_03180 [Flavobacteriales bacterium]|nr:hypothetical protein [Flavobacteriales bacterium]